MAINYRWTKIYNDTDLAADTPGAYTFLEGASNNTYNGATGNQDINTFAPEIYVSASYQNDREDAKLLGRILTDRKGSFSDGAVTNPVYTQNIYQPWMFHWTNGIGANRIQHVEPDDSKLTGSHAQIILDKDKIQWQYTGAANASYCAFSPSGFEVHDAVEFYNGLKVHEELEVWETATFSKKVEVLEGGISVTGDSTFSLNVQAYNLYATGICQAAYFNATSDLRAKKDINEHDFSDAFINDILESICTYHFKKDASDDPIFIGLIAQRVVAICTKHNVDPRIFVNHLDASGENGDYMSLNINNLMFLFALGLRHEKNKQLDLAARIKQLEEKING